MNLLRSNLVVYTALVALASFLGFWLYQEYQREVRALVMSSHLELATEIISDQDENLKELMSEMKQLTISRSLQLSVGFGDTVIERRSVNGNEVDHDIITTKANVYLGDSFPAGFPFDSIGADTSVALVLQYSNDEAADFFPGIMQGQRIEPTPEIKQQAMLNTWPQGLFAVLLLGLLITGIRLLQVGYRKKQEVLAYRNSLVSNLTHELKTPVSTVSVALEALQHFNVKDDKAKTELYIETSRKELSRLMHLIDMVMDLSALDEQAAKPNLQQHDVNDVCSEALELMQPQLAAAGVTAAVTGSISQPVDLDRTHLLNAIINLLDNAVKYGQPNGSVELQLSVQGTNAHIAVADDGPGIDPRHHDQLFERFYRVAQTDQHNVKGHGLGLSYVKEVARLHNGSVKLTSAPGKGSCFELIIPIHAG